MILEHRTRAYSSPNTKAVHSVAFKVVSRNAVSGEHNGCDVDARRHQCIETIVWYCANQRGDNNTESCFTHQ